MPDDSMIRSGRGSSWKVLLAWIAVSVPLLWGIWQTVKKAAVLFR